MISKWLNELWYGHSMGLSKTTENVCLNHEAMWKTLIP